VFLRWEKRFLLMESQIARDKGDDIRDVSLRLRKALAWLIHKLFGFQAQGRREIGISHC
jgi:hypothetical protein